jgi:hypothetical protein
MAVTSAVRARVHASLKRQRPASVKVYRNDSDDPTTITPTGERGRWERVVQAIPPTTERIELLDKAGGVLAALDVEPAEAASAANDDRDTKLLKLLVQAQEMALDRQTSHMTGIMGAYERLARMLAERLTSLERGYSSVLQAAFDATVMAGEAQAKLNGETDKGETESVMDAMAGELLKKLVGGNDKAPTASAAVVQKKIDKPANGASSVVK